MMENLFESRPDPELGAILRQHFEPGHAHDFTARVLARLGRRSGRTQWEVLAEWSRPGIAAGFLLAAILGYWLVLREEPVTPSATAEVLDAGQPVDPDGLMAVVLGSSR